MCLVLFTLRSVSHTIPGATNTMNAFYSPNATLGSQQCGLEKPTTVFEHLLPWLSVLRQNCLPLLLSVFVAVSSYRWHQSDLDEIDRLRDENSHLRTKSRKAFRAGCAFATEAMRHLN